MANISSAKKEVLKRDLDIQKIPNSIHIPSYIFKDRTLKVLEVLVEYLKEDCNLNYSEIAVLLNRDARTIWTVYQRALKKRENDKI